MSDKIRKYVLPNLPYLFVFWFFSKIGTAYRIAPGTDFGTKLMGMLDTFPKAFETYWPGLGGIDLLVGLAGAAGMYLLIQSKIRKAKKFRRDAEYGTARFGTKEDIKPFVDPKFQNNVILTGTEFLAMNTRPKIPANARNLNACVIGSSGSGKTRFWLTPQLLQAHSSYVVVDPKGGTLDQCGRFLQREKYRVRVFNSIDFSKSMHYNPLAYIKTESDVLKFVQKIFSPFERERTSTVSRTQGTGLGMAITKNIVDMMGGTIEVQTEQGKGTEFIIRLPLRIQPENHRIEKIAELEGLKALVVDDDFNTCDSVTKMLVKVGMRSEWTLSGKEAVLRARQSMEMGDAFHAYIIDWRLPDMNGIEVTRQIRSLGDDTPIIILTAYDWSDIEVEARAAGVTAFCAKPMFMSDIRETLMAAIGQKQAGADDNILPAADSDFRDRRILLVEDNELNSEIAVALLSEYGFRVDTAEDGAEAVEKVKNSTPGDYDLVLMDVQMPVMNGYEATERICWRST